MIKKDCLNEGIIAFYSIKIHIIIFSRLEQHFEIDRFVHQLDGQKYVDIKRFDKDTSMVLLVRFRSDLFKNTNSIFSKSPFLKCPVFKIRGNHPVLLF